MAKIQEFIKQNKKSQFHYNCTEICFHCEEKIEKHYPLIHSIKKLKIKMDEICLAFF